MNAPLTAAQLLAAMQTVVDAGDGDLPVRLEGIGPDGCVRIAFVDYICVMQSSEDRVHTHTAIGGRQA